MSSLFLPYSLEIAVAWWLCLWNSWNWKWKTYIGWHTYLMAVILFLLLYLIFLFFASFSECMVSYVSIAVVVVSCLIVWRYIVEYIVQCIIWVIMQPPKLTIYCHFIFENYLIYILFIINILYHCISGNRMTQDSAQRTMPCHIRPEYAVKEKKIKLFQLILFIIFKLDDDCTVRLYWNWTSCSFICMYFISFDVWGGGLVDCKASVTSGHTINFSFISGS